MSDARRLPSWLTKPIADASRTRRVRDALSRCRLNTVCNEARCPNRVDCFTRGTATFMILGDRCTRDCRFCAVGHGEPGPPDADEPRRVAEAVVELGLDYVVLTSVTRDDLDDGGASAFVSSTAAIRDARPGTGVEVLVPDFRGATSPLDAVLESRPTVMSHNVETVPRLYRDARPEAVYGRSLSVLERSSSLRDGGVKTAVMVGLGESREELESTLWDLRSVGVDIISVGQYLCPSSGHLPVARFVPPDEFEEIGEICRGMGFAWVSSGPFVRSSYRAEAAAAFLKLHSPAVPTEGEG